MAGRSTLLRLAEMRTLSAAAIALFFVAGCQSATPEKVAGDGGAPLGTAIVREADHVVVTAINGQKIRSKFTLFPTLRAAPRYEVPAGPCELRVEFSSNTGTASFHGVAKTLKFTALAGHAYTLNSRLATFHGGSLGTEEWDARIVDDAAKKVFVAQTTDMPK